MKDLELNIPGHHKHFYLVHKKHIQGQHYQKHWLWEIKIEIHLLNLVFF